MVYHYRHFAAHYYNILHKTSIKHSVQNGKLPNDLKSLSRIALRAQQHFETLQKKLDHDFEARETERRRYGSGYL